MRVIAAYSHKGGTGKTTALLMLANAIFASGKSALLVDCDPQKNFHRFKQESEPTHWPANCEIQYRNYALTAPADIAEALMDANDTGEFDYCLLNLPGTDDPFNLYVLRYAELTLIPFRPGATELVELAPAVETIQKLEEDGRIGAVRIVFSQTNDMNAAGRSYYAAAKDLYETLSYEIPKNAIFENIVMEGILARVVEDNADTAKGLDKIRIARLRGSLDDCSRFLSECDAIIDGVST